MTTETKQLEAQLAEVEATAKRLREELAAASTPMAFPIGSRVVFNEKATGYRWARPGVWEVERRDPLWPDCVRLSVDTGAPVSTYWLRAATPEEVAEADLGPAPFKVGDIVTTGMASSIYEITKVYPGQNCYGGWWVDVVGRKGYSGTITRQSLGQFRHATDAEKRVLTHFVPKVGMLLRDQHGNNYRVVGYRNNYENTQMLDLDSGEYWWATPDKFRRDRYAILPSLTLTGVAE